MTTAENGTDPVLVVKTITFGYDDDADRLFLDCSDPVTALRLWLTRRLTRRLLAAFAGALERSSPAVRKAPADARQEVMAMEHLMSLAVEQAAPQQPSPDAAAGDGTGPGVAQTEAASPPEDRRRAALVSRIDVEIHPTEFRLLLHSADNPLASVGLNRGEVHKVLAALDHWARVAEWDIAAAAGWLDGAERAAVSVIGRNAS